MLYHTVVFNPSAYNQRVNSKRLWLWQCLESDEQVLGVMQVNIGKPFVKIPLWNASKHN